MKILRSIPATQRFCRSTARPLVLVPTMGALHAGHASLIQRARGRADLVVMYMHAGAEGSDADHVTGQEETYVGEDRGNPEAFAHMAVDAGSSRRGAQEAEWRRRTDTQLCRGRA